MNNREYLQKLLWSMSQPRSFYVLGAGASFGLVPTMPIRLAQAHLIPQG